jgi:predicted molibdopterin-dependent oxidoreductase YjgC
VLELSLAWNFLSDGGRRLEDAVEPGRTGPHRVSFRFDGAPVEASRGMTIAGALLANGIVSWRSDPATDRPRGIFCGVGICFDCLVDVDGRQAVRACVVRVRDGDEVRTSVSRRSAE